MHEAPREKDDLVAKPELSDEGSVNDVDERRSTIDFLESNGFLKTVGNATVLNIERLTAYTKEIHEKQKGFHRPLPPSTRKVLDTLLTGQYVQEVTDGSGRIGPERPAFSLPTGKEAALRGVFDNDGLIEIEDFATFAPWGKVLTLADGSEFSYAELMVAKKLRELKATRGEDGVLMIFDSARDKYRPFSNTLFYELSGIEPKIRESEDNNLLEDEKQQTKKPISMRVNGILFASKFLPNLIKAGVLKPEDFSVSSKFKMAELFRVDDAHFGSKTSGYVYFNSGEAGGAKYYLGRNRIVGTDIQITQNAFCRKLDTGLIGVFDKLHGREVLLAYFPLLSESELREVRERYVSEKNPADTSKSVLASRTLVSGNEMEQRVRTYKITDFIPQRIDETAEQYAERVSKFSDVSFVTKTFSNFFREAGLGVHKLPWREQLIIADTILSADIDRDNLLNFAKKYGLAGLRTFLSMEYDKKIRDKIIALGDKLPREQAMKIFEKYAEIVDGLSVINTIAPEMKDRSEIIRQAEDNLLRRGKKVIEDFTLKCADSRGGKPDPNCGDIEGSLARISAENQVLLSVFKATQKTDPWLTFEKFKDVSFGQEFVGELSEEDTASMKRIYAENYKSTPKFQQRLLTNFDKIIADKEQPIQITRHKGKLVGFYLYTPRQDGSVELRCFNMDPVYAGGGFGKAMMNQEVERMAHDRIIHATCTAQLPISSEYIESGFVAVGHGQADEINYLEIVRNDRRRYFSDQEYLSRDFVELLDGKDRFEEDGRLVVASEDVTRLPFDICGKKSNGRVWVLTRYIRPKAEDHNTKTILVFYAINEDDLQIYKRWQ
jgi:predicted GNAT family acetyltransferase